MNPTSEILERINRSSKQHHDGVFTRLYRYLLREDIYYAAYQKLYSNKGSVTRGVDDDTADGFGDEYVTSIINDLKNGTYKPKPVRRKYILKANGKQRPLGIPSFRDKLIQEAVRMILEAIYEPVFYDQSHGFRPNRSCHTALKMIKTDFHGAKWFIEGDIRGCFDNINHNVLIATLGKKVKDSKFLNLIRQFLKAGYVEDFEYHATISGTPQGGIISPILANIYLHELDTKVMDIKAEFDRPASRSQTKEYIHWHSVKQRLRKKINAVEGEEREDLIRQYKEAGKAMKSTPAKCQDDKKIVYVRYADDFLIGVFGSRQDAENIKGILKMFLADEYSLELSDEKTKITHTSEKVRFLGYDVAVRRDQKIKRRKDGRTGRTLLNTVELTVPLEDKVTKYLFKQGLVEQKPDGRLWPIAVPKLRYLSELDIVRRFDAQFRGICNYYRLAANYDRLIYFQYLMEYSCLKTIASKHDTTVPKTIRKYRTKDGWGIPYKTKAGEGIAKMSKLADCRNGKLCIDVDPWSYVPYKDGALSIQRRLSAHTCELCGTHCEYVKVYHAGSMKELNLSTPWGAKMKDIRRKTLVVCYECYNTIHGIKEQK